MPTLALVRTFLLLSLTCSLVVYYVINSLMSARWTPKDDFNKREEGKEEGHGGKEVWLLFTIQEVRLHLSRYGGRSSPDLSENSNFLTKFRQFLISDEKVSP